MNIYKLLFLLLFSLSVVDLVSQPRSVKYGQVSEKVRQDRDMQKFRENRFGQFIHWGLFSIPAGEWNGKIYPGASEFLKSYAKISTDDWGKLKYQFNPVNYDPRQWAKYAQQMGVKYATLTTKHHEGFCLWPSEYTDFDMDETPSKRDLVGEFVKAYNDVGIDVYLYYSILDWYHPDWRYKLENKEDSVAFDRFRKYVKNQMAELVRRYPTIKGFWIDGTWDESWKKSGKFSYDLEVYLKKISPGLIINSRFRADEYGARHFDSNGVLMGDYESGYERRLPSPYDTIVPTRDWEAVMTIPENIWGYHKQWNGHIKSGNELIEMLTRCVALNGNFLLNFGPKADGSFREEEIRLFDEIGQWVQANGDAIFKCGYAGFERQDWGYYTARKNSNTINMVVFNVPVSKSLRVKLPVKLQLVSAKFTGSSGEIKGDIKIDESVNGEYFLHIPDVNYNKPFIIEIDVKQLEGDGNYYMAPLI